MTSNEAVLIPFGDLHIGNPGFRERHLQRIIEEIRKTPDCRCIGMGDHEELSRSAFRASIGSIPQDEKHSAMIKIDDMVRSDLKKNATKYFKPIQNKLIGLIEGNHHWDFQDGTTSTQYMCQLLGVPYLDVVSLIRLSMQRHGKVRKNLRVFAAHGWSSGYQLYGTDVNGLTKKASDFEADIYIAGHTHRGWMIPDIPTLTIPERGTLKVINRPRCFVRTSSAQVTYDETTEGRHDYAQKKMFSPSAMRIHRIYIRFEQLYDREAYRRGSSGTGNYAYDFEVRY